LTIANLRFVIYIKNFTINNGRCLASSNARHKLLSIERSVMYFQIHSIANQMPEPPVILK